MHCLSWSMSPPAFATFLIAVTKYLTKSNLRKNKFTLTFGLKTPSQSIEMGKKIGSQEWVSCSLRIHTQEEESEQEVGQGYKTSRLSLEWPIFPSKAPNPKGSITFSSITSNQDQLFVTNEPVGDTSQMQSTLVFSTFLISVTRHLTSGNVSEEGLIWAYTLRTCSPPLQVRIRSRTMRQWFTVYSQPGCRFGQEAEPGS